MHSRLYSNFVYNGSIVDIRPSECFACAYVGCGTGNYSKALSPFVAKVTGLEHSEGMLEKARMKTEGLNNVGVLQGDITDMPFPNEHFDGVMINQVLYYSSCTNSVAQVNANRLA